MNWFWETFIEWLNLIKCLAKTIYWYKHRSKEKKAKNDFEKDFL